MTMPDGVRVFVNDTVRGLEGGGHSLSIHQDGTLEYDSPTAEYSTRLPQVLADELYAAFEGRAGDVLGEDEEIEVGETEAEDPQQMAGRKRRARSSRVKKQTRRTQRKRRNTVRK